MKYLFFILLLFGGVASAQTTYYIQADSTRLRKVGANNELIVENGTRTRTGAYLKNTLNGRTGFFYAVDSAYISGSNLVLVRGGGTQNVTVAIGTAGNVWSITGNSGTAAGTNFIGTTDSVDLVGKTKSLERFRWNARGALGLGTGTDYGTSGYLLKTNGAASAPTWVDPATLVTATPTWQQVLTAGSTLTQTNNIEADIANNHGITFGKATSFGSFEFHTDGLFYANSLLMYLRGVDSVSVETSGLIHLRDSSIYGTSATNGHVWTLIDDTDGEGTWKAPSTVATSVPLSGITAATGTNSINNGNHPQTWSWNTLDGVGLFLTSSSTVATGGTVLFGAQMTGAHSTSGITSTALDISNLHSGTTSINVGISSSAQSGTTNIAGKFEALSGTNNYAIIVPSGGGNVGIGTSTPTSLLHVVPVHTTGIGVAVASSTTTSGSIMDITGTSTALAANNEGLNIGISGANGTNGITATGARISVTNTNATSGTNVALELTASGATTANNALNIAAGAVTLNGSAGTSGQVLTSAGANTLPTWTTPSGSYYSYPINIDSLGAVGDGSTDNATVFNTARQLSLSTGRPILIPSGTYYTSDSIILNKQTIFGYGYNSIIKVTSATVTSIYLEDSCEVFGIKFIGTGAGAVPGGVLTTQNGIRVIGGYNNIHDCIFTSITGSGIGIWEDGGAPCYQNRGTNNKFLLCTVGIFSLLNEEYSIYSENDIYACTVGIWDRSGGNTRWVNNTAAYCTVDGFRLSGGGNGDHSSVVGCTFNHNATNVNIQSTNLGEIFVGCNIEAANGGNNINFGSSGTANKVVFAECNLYDGNIAGTSASGCVVRDCNILPGGGGVTHSGSGIVYVNNNGSSDAQYWKSDLNTVGADGKLIGTSDNYDFTIKTNNTSRVNILKTGEIGIGTAGATGFKMFIVSTGNSASTYHSLYRNANGENILTIQDDGTFGIGNVTTGTNTSRFYGNVGIGVSPSTALHILKTTEQLRVGYDASNYYSTTVGSTGGVTFNAVGAGSAFTFSDNLDVTGVVSTDGLNADRTITAGGTTGNQTINKMAGTVNFAAAATTLTVTNSLVDANSIIFCVVRTNDATATIKNVVPGSGSFVITLTAAATAETSVGFIVTN